MAANCAPHQGAVAGLTHMVEEQAVMLVTLNISGALTIVFDFAATLIWLGPRPKGPIDTSGAH